MADNYLDRLYSYIGQNDPTFQDDVSIDDFASKMQDRGYAAKMYTWISSMDNTFKQDMPFDTFVKKALGTEAAPSEPVKKKEQPIPSKALPGLGSPMEKGDTESISPNFSSAFTKPSSPQLATEQPTTEQPEQQAQATTPIQPKSAQRTEFVTKATPEEGYKAPAVQSFAKQMEQEGVSKEQPKDDFFNDSIQIVNKDLMGKSIEEVANTLKYHFEDYGFDVKQDPNNANIVDIQAKNGQKMQFRTDELFNLKDQAIADNVKDFLRENRNESERLKTIESGAIEKEKKIINQDDIKQRVTSIDNDTQAFNSDIKLYLQAKALYDEEKNKYVNITPDQLAADPQLKQDYDSFLQNRKRLSEIGGNIAQKEEELKHKGNALESAVGKYTASKASVGNWGGAIWNSIIDNVSSIVGGTGEILADIYNTNKPLDVNSQEYKDSFIKAAKQKGIEIPAGQDFDTFYKSNFKNIQDIESQMRDNMKKEVKYGTEGKVGDIEKVKSTLKDYLGSETTTPEYINKLEQNTIGKAALGLARFAPAMVAAAYSGNAGFLTAALSAHDGVMEQMNSNPSFKNISEDEKNAFAAPYDIANGLLMSGGFTKAATQSSFVGGLVARALNKMTKGATAKTFEELVAKDIQNWAAKRVLTVADGFMSGAESGVEMAAFDLAMKDVYNDYKGKEMFKTPFSNEKLSDVEKAKEYSNVLLESGLVMGIGGGILSIPKAMNVYQLYPVMENYRGRLIDNGTFEIFEQTAKDPEYQRMFKVDYQNKVNQGLIPFEQAKKEYDNYVKLKGLLQSVDPSLNTEQRREALAILQEKQQLEKDIAGKDPNQGTIKAKQDRIAKLNDMLSNIATPQYTIEGKSLDKQEFIDKINSMGKEELNTLNANVKNDQEVQKLLETKIQENAIQEPSTETGVLRPTEPEVGLPKVGEGNAQEQAITEEGGQVAPAKEGEVTAEITDEEYKNFVDKGIVSDERLTSIADKIKNSEKLSPKEMEIFTDKTAEVETKIKESKPAETTAAKEGEIKTQENLPEKEKTIEEFTKENPKIYASIANKIFKDAGYHSGTLLDKSDYSTPYYNGDMPFTGYYFVSNPEMAARGYRSDSNNKVKIVDFSNYNLLKPSTNQYWAMKFNLKSLVTKLIRGESYKDIFSNQLDNFRYQYPKLFLELKSLNGDALFKEYQKNKEEKFNSEDKHIERFETILLKELGYEGVDVRGLKESEGEGSPDKFSEGSVIFDLKPNTVTTVSESYNKAKTDNTNPELVKAVEEAIGKPAETTPAKEGEVAEPIKVEPVKEEKPKIYDTIKSNIDAMANQPKAEVEKQAKQILEASDEYMNANDTQKEKMTRDVNEMLGIKEKAAPSAEKILGQKPKEVVVKDEMAALKDQIRLEEKAAKEGAKSVVEVKKTIIDAIKEKSKDVNLTRNDLKKAMDLIKSVKDQATLSKAIDKLDKLIENANPDIVEVSKTKLTRKIFEEKFRSAFEAAKEKKKSLDEIRKDLGSFVKSMLQGKDIPDRLYKSIISRVSRVNLDKLEMINKELDYIDNAITNADNINKADGLKASIQKLSNSKQTQGDLAKLGGEFAKIEPSKVENIEEYNDIAARLKESMKGSTYRSTEITYAEMVKQSEVSDYIKKTLEAQEKSNYEDAVADVLESMGIDVSGMSYQDIMKLADPETKITKENRTIIMDGAKKAFDVYSGVVNDMIEKGVDPISGEKVEYTEAQKKIAKEFMDMDLGILSPKEAIRAIDALRNFLENGSIYRMEATIAEYKGEKNVREAHKVGLKAKPLSMFGSEGLGQFFGEQATNYSELMTKLFGGVSKGKEFEKLSGAADVINGKSKAEYITKSSVLDFVDKFYDKKANGLNYNTRFNATERGMFAEMARTAPGTAEQIQAEFDKSKRLVEQSIEVLKKGSDNEKAKGRVYEEVYNKILKDSKNIDEVRAKTDKNNVEGVQFWIDKFGEYRSEFENVSEAVYNTELEKDLNYTSRKMKALENAPKTVSLNESDKSNLKASESAFHTNSTNNDVNLYKNKSNGLREAVKPEDLPTNDNDVTTMYLDFDFDSNMSNSLYDMLVDTYTAKGIRQMDAFQNSKEFDSLFEKPSDADIVKQRNALLVKNIRNRNIVNADQLHKALRLVNEIAKLGVGQALGGPLQIPKQIIPVAINTLVNAGEFDFNSVYNPDAIKLMMESGRGIANRGLESSSEVNELRRLIDDTDVSLGEKGFKGLEKISEWYLKKFLVNPDVWVARASWLTYYKQALAKEGVDVSNFDWSTHKLNEDAADYAQAMVDRQQNVSDKDLAGKFYSNKDPLYVALKQTLLPFSSFRVNQAMRMHTDISVLNNETATAEDKAIAKRSLAASAAEIAMFSTIAGAASYLLGSLAMKLAGKDESEEDSQKRLNNIVKGQLTRIGTEAVSPIPLLDIPTQWSLHQTLDEIQNLAGKSEDEKINIFPVKMQQGAQSLGALGVTADRVVSLAKMASLASSGTYKDDYGNEKSIDDQDKDNLKALFPFAVGTATGLLPPEVNTLINDYVKAVKKYPNQEGKAAEEAVKAMRAEKKAEGENIEAKLLHKLIKTNRNPKLQEAFKDQLKQLNETKEEKAARKAENKIEQAKKKGLLGEYDNQEDLKKYNPRLWNKNFGPDSKWAKEHKVEKKAKELFNDAMEKYKNKKYHYTPKAKPVKPKLSEMYSEKKVYNADGTLRRSYTYTRKY